MATPVGRIYHPTTTARVRGATPAVGSGKRTGVTLGIGRDQRAWVERAIDRAPGE